MKRKIFLFSILAVALSTVLVFIFGIIANSASHYKQAENKIKDIAYVYAAYYTDELPLPAPDGIRITIIKPDGIVVADSESKAAIGTNHKTREEFEAAVSGNPKIVKRYSNTVKCDMLYYVLKAENSENYIRVALSVEKVNGYIQNALPAMIAVTAVAIILSIIFAQFSQKAVFAPLNSVKNNLELINKGNYKQIEYTSDDKELNEIISSINSISEKLNLEVKTSKREKEKLDYIISNISDAIIVLDEKGEIELLNKNAAKLFSVTNKTHIRYSVLTADQTFKSHVQKCLDEKTADSFELQLHSSAFYCTVNLLENGDRIIVLSDITAIKNNEKMRSEFFANASHELKTPLTAIKGFNDVISLSTKEQSTATYSAKIDKEVFRLVNLIDDMLSLSKLEYVSEITPENVELNEIANEVKESLSALAAQKNITVEISGTAKISAERDHAFRLIKNLVENSIRYNNDGGLVKITLSETQTESYLTVEDNGIGIEEEHLNRIFERFYRVNKSRSRETGGTGLGLSIVKHICNLYGAEIILISKYGEGTKVTIKFKK